MAIDLYTGEEDGGLPPQRMTKQEIARASTRELEERRREILRAADGTDVSTPEVSHDRELWDIDDELDRRKHEQFLYPRDEAPGLDPAWWLTQ
jgi:hypothetical protein